MGGRVGAWKVNKKYLCAAVGFVALLLAVVLVPSLMFMGCRNPLMDFIESSGISVQVGGRTMKSGGVYDLGPVKRDGNFEVDFTIVNSGNLDLRLTGEPAVKIVADPVTAGMFDVAQLPAELISVRGSSSFTLQYTPVGADAARSIELVIENNSRTADFSFELASFVDGTPPSI
jgi:hypothetical protein